MAKTKTIKEKGFVFSSRLQKKLESLVTDESQTQLDGVRLKVFTDRYSLKDEEGEPVEEHPEQMWRRVAAGLESHPDHRPRRPP